MILQPNYTWMTLHARRLKSLGSSWAYVFVQQYAFELNNQHISVTSTDVRLKEFCCVHLCLMIRVQDKISEYFLWKYEKVQILRNIKLLYLVVNPYPYLRLYVVSKKKKKEINTICKKQHNVWN
jgi:hypothetical protein